MPDPSDPGTLVGRDAELAMLHDGWRTGGSTFVVSGPAGIGKSRLLRELAVVAERHGGGVLVGRSTASARAAPLRPITEALLGAARRGARPGVELEAYVPVLGRLVPDWAPAAAPEPAVLPTLQLGEGLLRFAAQVAPGHPALLILEDLHWADPESLDVLEYLADNVHDHPLTVIASLRTGEPGAGTELARSLVQRRVARDIELGPLDRAAIAELARARLGAEQLPDEVSDALRDRSEGVPFFVEELVATAMTSGWETVAAAVPGSILTSVELRLETFDEPLRRLLVAASLLGRNFDCSIAAAACDIDPTTAASLLGTAARAQLLDVEDGGFRFRHALTRDAVLASAPPADRDVLARAALAVIADDTHDIERCLVAAELAVRSDDPRRASDLLLRAARHALAQGTLTSADRFATQARELAGSDGDDIDEVLLEICVLTGDTERGSTLSERLLGAAIPPERLADRHLLVASIELAAGRWDAALAHTAVVSELVPADRARTARADALAAQAAMGQDDVATALRRAAEALAAATTEHLTSVQCEALEVIGRIERGRDLATAEAAFQQAHDVAAAAGLIVWRVRALQELGTVDLFDTLRLDRLHEARREASRIGAHATIAMVDLQLAALHLERGEVADALAVARRCAETSHRFGLSTEPMGVVVQAMAHARRGDRTAMEQVLADAESLARDVDYVEAAVWGNVLPVFHIVQGDLPSAAAALDRAMDVIRRRPAAVLPYPGLWALMRTVLDDGGDHARAEAVGLQFDTPVSRRALLAAEAVAAGRAGHTDAADRFAVADRYGCAEAFRRFLVRLLVAPAAAADGWGDPVGWLRESLAHFERLDLETLAGRCRRELRSMGAAVPRRSAIAPAPVPAGLAGLGVTGREVEVLTLVAAGATNREVAERLVISPRTVDKHVERVLQKTGSTRVGLQAIARDAGLLDT